MERISRIGISGSTVRKLSRRLLELGIKLKVTKLPGGHDITVFLISENHPHFSEVMKIARDNELFVLVEAKFSSQDYQQASHFTLFGMPKTYPSPSDGFRYRTITYDDSKACWACGVGLKQIGPFRLEREVKLKEREVIGLHWVFDEVFVSPLLASEVFDKLGVETREVFNSNGKRILPGVKQLVVPDVFVSIDTNEFKLLKCSSCSREKYQPRRDVFFPRLMETTSAPIFKTSQYLGSGAEAYRQIVINKDVYSALVAAKAKSTIIDPVAV